jgi:hypothetical protein
MLSSTSPWDSISTTRPDAFKSEVTISVMLRALASSEAWSPEKSGTAIGIGRRWSLSLAAARGNPAQATKPVMIARDLRRVTGFFGGIGSPCKGLFSALSRPDQSRD